MLIAHRGFDNRHPGNSLQAIRRAARMGVPFVEFDVQMSKDQVAFVWHDATFTGTNVGRVFPGRAGRSVNSFTWAEIGRLEVRGGYRITSLGAALRAVRRNAGVEVMPEIKQAGANPGAFGAVAGALRRTQMVSRAVVQIQSRHKPSRFARLLPGARIAVLDMSGRPAPSRWAGYWGLSLDYTALNARYVASAHRSGLRVVAWTVPNASTTRRLASYGVDGVMVDRPGDHR